MTSNRNVSTVEDARVGELAEPVKQVRGSELVSENAEIIMFQSEIKRKWWLFIASLVLIAAILALFGYGFCSYIEETKRYSQPQNVSVPVAQSSVKNPKDEVQGLRAVDSQMVAKEEGLGSNHPPDWHFLLILAELLFSMVLVFFITMKAVFPKADDKVTLMPSDVNGSIKNLVDLVKSLWSSKG